MKSTLRNISPINKVLASITRLFGSAAFRDSKRYWEDRYRNGGDSGVGSYGKFAEFKAAVVNDFVLQNGVASVLEFGHGDGNQLKLADYPSYTGFDVSRTAVANCRELFLQDSRKQFFHVSEYQGQSAELSMSLDVIFHLVEDEAFEAYMHTLFSASTRYVIIYSSNSENIEETAPHVKHRHFTQWVENHIDGWTLIKRISNKYPYNGNYLEGSFADFYFYAKK